MKEKGEQDRVVKCRYCGMVIDKPLYNQKFCSNDKKCHDAWHGEARRRGQMAMERMLKNE